MWPVSEQGRCSKCGEPRDRPGRYCKKCHAAYMREWRKRTPQTEEQRRKASVRAYTNVLVKRGLITKKPCLECGSEVSEAHHIDYSNPHAVLWLCREHHLDQHRQLASMQ